MSRIGRAVLGLLLTAGCVVAPVGVGSAAAVADYACHVFYEPHEHTGGFNAEIVVKNTGVKQVRGWTLSFPLPQTVQIISIYNAVLVVSKGQIETRSLAWNADVDPGKSINLGFGATGPVSTPSEFRVNGILCTTGPLS